MILDIGILITIVGIVMKIEDIIYSFVVMVCLTWAVYTVANSYAPEHKPSKQIEQEELIEISEVK